MSRPCAKCIEILKIVGIRSVYYSTETGEIIREKVKNMSSNHLSQAQKHLHNINSHFKIK
jgi:tRNA(Arg) A34 adenosine deaminase TadA